MIWMAVAFPEICIFVKNELIKKIPIEVNVTGTDKGETSSNIMLIISACPIWHKGRVENRGYWKEEWLLMFN